MPLSHGSLLASVAGENAHIQNEVRAKQAWPAVRGSVLVPTRFEAARSRGWAEHARLRHYDQKEQPHQG
jgi:hypothetical protein